MHGQPPVRLYSFCAETLTSCMAFILPGDGIVRKEHRYGIPVATLQLCDAIVRDQQIDWYDMGLFFPHPFSGGVGARARVPFACLVNLGHAARDTGHKALMPGVNSTT
jgi:hypothetical protein